MSNWVNGLATETNISQFSDSFPNAILNSFGHSPDHESAFRRFI